MASSTKPAFLAVTVLLLLASWCAVADVAPAVMTVTSFESPGGNPGAACDGNYYSNGELIVALPTGPYLGGERCHHKITIASAQTLRTVTAEVVDECDCEDNIVATSQGVWNALGLDTNIGEVPIAWTDA